MVSQLEGSIILFHFSPFVGYAIESQKIQIWQIKREAKRQVRSEQ